MEQEEEELIRQSKRWKVERGRAGNCVMRRGEKEEETEEEEE